MNIIKTSTGWKITDEENNYLDYIEHHKIAKPCYGKVDNINIKAPNNRTWQRDGKGKMPEATWEKIINLDNYFKNNY